MGQTVGLPSDAVGFRLGAGCLAHEGLMLVNGVDNFPGGAEFVALSAFARCISRGASSSARVWVCSLAAGHGVCRNASTNHELQVELLTGETAR